MRKIFFFIKVIVLYIICKGGPAQSLRAIANDGQGNTHQHCQVVERLQGGIAGQGRFSL